MSLYSLSEVCEWCVNATFFDCGSCLKECKVGAQSCVSPLDGFCPQRKLKENAPKHVREDHDRKANRRNKVDAETRG